MLFVPAGANSFGKVQETITGRPANAMGTAMTPAVGSKGAWAQVIASLDEDTFGLVININSNSASATCRNSVVDIGIGPASSEVVLIADLIGGNAIGYNGNGNGIWYYFPVALPAGTRIAARAQSTVTTGFRVHVQAALQSPLQPAMLKKAAFVETIGMTAPGGTAVTSGTTANGAWTLLGTTTNRCWFWQIGAQVDVTDTSHSSNVYHLDLAEGDGTNFNPLILSQPFTTSTAETSSMSAYTVACEVPVPAGRSIYARAQCSGSIDPLFIAAYGAGG